MDHEGWSGRAEGQAAIASPRLILGVALALLGGAAAAQGEYLRRLGAELVIVGGDLRRLEAAAEPPRRLEGLRARVSGALATLPMLTREAGFVPSADLSRLRAAWAQGDLKAASAIVARLRQRHPLDLSHVRGMAAVPAAAAAGRAIHRQACAGCHERGQADGPLTALDLAEQARSMPAEEFAARLLAGVRGTSGVAYRNPFGDLEIGALIAFYTTPE